MKNLILLLIAITLSGEIWAGSIVDFPHKQKKQLVELTVHFQTNSGSSLIDTYVWDARNFTDYQQIYSGKIIDNKVSFRTRTDHPVIVGFETDSLNLYASRQAHSITRGFLVEPGDHLHLEVGKHMELGIQNIIFSGRGAAKYKLIQELISGINGKQRKWDYYLNIDELFARADSDRSDINRIFERYRNRVSSLIFKALKLEYTLNAYSSATSALLEQIDKIKDRSKYASYIAALKSEFTDKNAGYDYSNFAFMYTLARLNSSLKSSGGYDNNRNTNQLFDKYRLLKSTYAQNRQIAEPLLAQFIISNILHKGKSESIDECIHDFIAYSSRSGSNYQQVNQILHAYKVKFDTGSPAYEFMLHDTSGHIVKQSDFKGKIVVLDFFFTGCVGCITTTPFLDSLESIYKGKPIVFVSISVDKSPQTWRKGIGTYSGKNAVQLFTDGKATMHPVVQYYQVNSYPAIILIDKAGNLLTARAPDPRTKEGWIDFRKRLDRILDSP